MPNPIIGDVTQTAHEIDAAAPVLANSVPDAADTRVIARYADPGGWLDKKPAIVTRSVGEGSIT
ncbi:hypothetical protein [Sphingomonas sp. GC_Shp_3]|uniref:hypothetical protein n=1 Tax=Sphingomonas sp. GC_Shp_3 TaxID=2937383 RepID=UPI002269F2AE|nr:hypothetical protein [Sphingomonas sp. GC_Shp_3]